MNMEQVSIDPPKSIRLDIGDMTVSIFKSSTISAVEENNLSQVHYHTMFEFQYIESGALSIVTDTNTYTLNSGDMILIPPNVIHRSQNSDEIFRRYVFSFTLGFNRDATHSFSEYSYYSMILNLPCGAVLIHSSEIIRSIKSIYSLSDIPEAAAYHKMKIYFELIFIELAESIKKTFPIPSVIPEYENNRLNTDGKRKWIIENFISLYYMKEDSIENLMSILCMSKRNTHRIVKELMGENFHVLILRQRMLSAEIMLKKTDMLICDIAEAVGYMSYVGFFTAFKKYHNISPDNFRTK